MPSNKNCNGAVLGEKLRYCEPPKKILTSNISRENNENSKWRKFPYKIEKVAPNLNELLLKDFTGERNYFVQVGDKKWFFPSKYEKASEILYNFQVKKDDVWIVTFPRSGTTWAQELVWLLANNLDYEEASRIPLGQRFPFLEFSVFVNEQTKAEFLNENKADKEKAKIIENIDVPAWESLKKTSERRFIKTHLPFSLLPPDILKKGCKVIYIARNPKDVAVSFYHLNRSIRTQGYLGDFPKYWDYFERNLQPWTPYWEHLKEGWSRRMEDNLLFMFYEDMNQDLQKCIQRISKFLGKTYKEDELYKLESHLQIENFRKNKSVNNDVWKSVGLFKQTEEGFVRRGRNGGWKTYFTKELNERANKWIEINLRDTDLRFPRQSEVLF